MREGIAASFCRVACVLALSALPIARAATGSFDTDVRPVLTGTCSACHNAKLASGGLDVALFLDQASISARRDGWERIVSKLESGEMPPIGIPRPPVAQIDAFLRYTQGQFER